MRSLKQTVSLLALLLAGSAVLSSSDALLAAPGAVAGGSAPVAAAADQAGAAQRIAEAQAIFDRVAAFYRSLAGFSGEETISGNVSGLGRIPATTRKFLFERPNKLVIHKPGTQDLSYYSDGKTVTQTDASNKLYMKTKAPANFESAEDMLVRVVDVDGLLGAQPFKFLKGEVTDARISKSTGNPSIGGKPTVTVTLQSNKPGRQRLIYQFEDSSTPFILNRSQLGSMDHRTVTSKIAFANWTIEKKPNPKAFAAVIPPGFKELTAEMIARGNSPLIGKPAPDFSLKTLDGKTISLASFKGKSAVAIDFWATWCPPCRKTFPAFAGMSVANKGKPITFIGVLVHDDPKNAKEFLEKNRLSVNVAIDDESVAKKYQIDGIPTTILIDKQGIVRAVPPISDDYESKLTTLIKSL